MVLVREARRAFADFHTRCFWSYDPSYRITKDDIPWVVRGLLQHGGREGYVRGRRLCR